MRDHPGAAGIVDEDVEPALGLTDRGGESFDRTSILRRGTAGAMAGAGQARDQLLGRPSVIGKGDDNTRPGLGEPARRGGTETFAAAGDQRYSSLKHAHAGRRLLNRLRRRAAGPGSA